MTRRLRETLVAAVLFLDGTLAGAQKPATSCRSYDDRVTAFIGATVVPMNTAPRGEASAQRVLPGHTVIIRGGRIAWVGPAANARLPAGVTRVDARGTFLVPGLADMHVHASDRDFPVFLANGVTTVRELNGSSAHLEWRTRLCAGELLGPTLHVVGPLMAGEKQRWRHVLVPSPEDARRLVAEQVDAGYEAIKVYDGLTRDTYGVLVATARARGVRAVGHIPESVGLAAALAAGQEGIEHTASFMGELLTPSHEVDTTRLESIAAMTAKANVWVTPNLVPQYILARRRTRGFDRMLDRPELRYVDSDMRAWWMSLRSKDTLLAATTEFPSDRARSFYMGHKKLLMALHRAGVRMLAGSDTPNPMLVPGFSLHDELETLITAGLSPAEVLAMATRNAAEFLGRGAEFGSITVGARADLLLLEKNPLADISHLRRPAGVMIRGKWLSRTELERMLEASAR